MISQYHDATAPSGPRNLRLAVRKQLIPRGFIVSDHVDRQAQFYADMGSWIAQGKIKYQETVLDGIENAPRAFLGLFRSENTGKMLVRLG
jgi:NADPH-dependent curcumin reductase CurA